MNSQIILDIIEKEKQIFLDKNNDVSLIKREFSFAKMKISPIFSIFISFISLPVWLFLISSQIFIYNLLNLTSIHLFLLTSLFICAPLSILLTLNAFKLFHVIFFKISENNKNMRNKLLNDLFEGAFFEQKVNEEVKNLIKITLTDNEYFKLLDFNNVITYQSALYILKEKVRKENAITDKHSVVLDLRKLKEYGIQVVNQ